MSECIPCNKCKWFKGTIICEAPQSFDIINYITCEKAQEFVCCKTNREWESRCGKNAKWFELKKEEEPKQKDPAWYEFWRQ